MRCLGGSLSALYDFWSPCLTSYWNVSPRTSPVAFAPDGVSFHLEVSVGFEHRSIRASNHGSHHSPSWSTLTPTWAHITGLLQQMKPTQLLI